MIEAFKRFQARHFPSPDAVKHVAVPQRGEFDKGAKLALGLRRAMWVMTPQYGVGILTSLTADGVAEVMLIDDHGGNRTAVLTQANELRQAAWNEIPEPRRPERSFAAGLGYI